MSGKGFNYFVRDYDSIKKILRNMYVYGCYDRNQYIRLGEIRGKTYDNGIRKIKFIFDQMNQQTHDMKGKKIFGFEYDRYDNIGNFLVKSYKMKTFNSQDINLYFFILQILAMSEEACSISELIAMIQEEVYCDVIDEDKISPRMIGDKLEELRQYGYIDLECTSPKKYRIRDNFLDEFDATDLSKIHQALYLYRNIYKLGALSYFIQDTLKNHLTYEKMESCESEDVFLFKHNFIVNILNEENLYLILMAMERSNIIDMTYTDKDNTDSKKSVVPLKVISELDNGRQFLFCYNCTDHRLNNYRIDKMSKVKMTKINYDFCDYSKYISLMDKFWSLKQLNDLSNPMESADILIEVDFYIPQDKRFILTQLELEKRQGNVEKIDEDNYLFSIQVKRPYEMIPWIRSFGEVAKVRKSEVHDLSERIKEDWRNLANEYGIV